MNPQMNFQFLSQLTPQQKNFNELIASAKKTIQQLITYIDTEGKSFFSVKKRSDGCIEVRYLDISFIIRIQYKHEKSPSYRIQLIAYIENPVNENDFSTNQIIFSIDKLGNITNIYIKDDQKFNEEKVLNDTSEAEYILEKIITVLYHLGYTKTY